MNQSNDTVDVGVIGVGSMGKHHTRVYKELPGANLVGVYDVSQGTAQKIAQEYGTKAMGKKELHEQVDAVSLAVPTEYHYDEAMACLDSGVGVLIEKPVVEDPKQGRKLAEKAKKAGVPIQVGHIERFNPAIMTLEKIIEEMTVISVRTERLGPPPERHIDDSAVLDLMIHDIDIVLSLLDTSPEKISSAGVDGNRHATAMLELESGAIASLTASRMTQQKIRRIQITAEECFIEVDLISQSIEIHRQSVPEYVEQDGDVRYRHESITERPTVSNGEPLKKELSSFIQTIATGQEPSVTISEGIRALEIAREIERKGDDKHLQLASHD